MKEPILESLIDQYLMGTISPGDRTFLEKAMANDPSVSVMVEESKLAYKAIVLERNRLLKEKLRQLDKEDLREQHFMPRRLGVATLIVVLVILIASILTSYYRPESVARRNFEELATEAEGWQAASQAFNDKDYEKSIHAYTVLTAISGENEQYIARWNILMGQLAIDGHGPGWQLALVAFTDEAPERWADKGKALSALINSRLYRIWYSPIEEKFSTLKPRLM